MHLIETLSLNSGLEIGRPFISESFYPIVSDKYITVHTEDHPSKQWDHFASCLSLLRPHLLKEGIEIIEVGYNQYPLPHVKSIKNSANLNQTAQVIKNSLLHIGPEGLFIQLASYYNKPLISLFSNTSVSYAAPRWGDASNEVLIEGFSEGKIPSFQGQENPKSINSIFPEVVAKSVLAQLGISVPPQLLEFTPISCGALSHSPCVEVVPDFEPNPEFCPRTLLNIRLDYGFNESFLLHFANNRKITLVSDSPVSLPLVRQIRPAIEHFFYHVSPESDLSYLSSIKNLGIPITLFGKPDHEIDSTRFHLFDWSINEIPSLSKKNLDKSVNICENTYFQSSKSLYSKGIEYPCKLFWEKGIKKEKYNKIIDTDSFWDELEHYKLYEKTSNDTTRKTPKK